MSAIEKLNTFTVENLPDLDVVVLGALELFSKTEILKMSWPYKRPMVLGSGNAFMTAKVLFTDVDAVFADESSYEHVFERSHGVDSIVILSSSGSKHAVTIAAWAKDKGLPTLLLTNNENAPAKESVDENNVIVLPKNREPYTYNTSTYMGMILSKTGESAVEIYEFISAKVDPVLAGYDLSSFDAYTLIIPKQFYELSTMLRIKFEELFGPRINGRVFTDEEIKHAKTVVPSDKELFISFGEANEHFGSPNNRLTVPLPHQCDYAGMMAVGYYTVGKIQAAYPPYFKENVVAYTKQASEIFGKNLGPIVE